MSPRSCFQVALRALSKNKLQTGLTMIGLTIGVATVLTMIALGSGAQASIQDQVKAAGMNMIFNCLLIRSLEKLSTTWITIIFFL